MIVSMFSSKPYDERYFAEENQRESGHDIIYQEAKLTAQTAPLAVGSRAVCAFVNDHLDRAVLEQLKAGGTEYIAMRCAGFNNVDLQAADELGLKVVRVPAYSPHAVAEHTLALLLTLNRRIHRAYNRVREGNFSLNGLVGFDLYGLTVGIVGTGKIGQIVAQLFKGLGCKLVCYDVFENDVMKNLGAEYVSLDELFACSDVITLHCPLLEATHHLINAEAIQKMKSGVTLLNTSRGGLIDTTAVIEGLKSGQIGNLGIDVYEEEDNLFFEDQSGEVMQDDVFARLLTFPNVLITGHQAFFTDTALTQIARVTLQNLTDLEIHGLSENEIRVQT
ncbi:2-hydroxyacid dehydrogenase [Coraliomargarita akajimensis]|uniref:D-isomer specific 2-hydroxyacid dehydrogenase NAD-binding protein n=1 Tax=Coraliomargarita akajimensis (strain DSM 45221 / IAM 15411 / JCM 23193 / KCTC 12865 / 04OKA010-24) TaxID=583355 RepID=D5EIX0_CORAD|nr:2-hydroxyacid dehydrogenase [Coraliomargarita akajimensis]ADE54369.1 D-isomer specific 2-hydroxyacid dehydrogenase NAD-binding protein [Coraliomargarita akajimensis DSM 45221]